MNFTEAVNVFTNMVVQTKGLPFEVKTPNAETKKAIKESLKNPQTINMNKVDAQQARRLLDRIVGYKLSPLMSSKIQKGLSAGRVQSAALKLIVDRE